MITLILIFNLIVEPYQANAVGAVGSIASIVGKEKAAELIVFLLASAVVGVDFLEESWSDEDNLNKVSNLNNLIIADFPQWQPPDNGWKDLLKDLITIGKASSLIYFIESIKDWFQEKGAVEGENFILDDNQYYDYLNGWNFYVRKEFTLPGDQIFYMRVNNSPEHTHTWSSSYIIHSIKLNSVLRVSDYIIKITYTTEYTYNGVRSSYQSIDRQILSDYPIVGGLELDDSDLIKYFYTVSSDSIILSDRNPFEIPEWYQPRIPLIVETQEELLPDGTNQIKYDGDIDQLVDELIENISLDDIRDLEQRSPYELVETDGQTVIRTGEESEPYPEPEVDTDTGLIQSIINWLDKILKAIKELPQNIVDKVKTALEDLFVPSTDYMQTKIGSINTSIHEKIGNSSDIPVGNYFEGLTCLPIPDGYYREHKIFDASYINNLAETICNWQRWVWYILFALMNINNVYKLIRGTDLIHIGQYQGGSGGVDIYRGGK